MKIFLTSASNSPASVIFYKNSFLLQKNLFLLRQLFTNKYSHQNMK